jgi:hypothetical protein
MNEEEINGINGLNGYNGCENERMRIIGTGLVLSNFNEDSHEGCPYDNLLLWIKGCMIVFQ